MPSFSELVHRAVADVEDVLVPRGLPSDTREASAIAKDAAGVATTLDPELEPLFALIAGRGDDLIHAAGDIAETVGKLKAVLATRAAAPVSGLPPGLPAPTPPGQVPVGVPSGGAPAPPGGAPNPFKEAAARAAALRAEAEGPGPRGAAADASGFGSDAF